MGIQYIYGTATYIASGRKRELIFYFIINITRATAVEISTGNLKICYVSFCTINFLFLLPYSFRVIEFIEWYVEADF
jgi:hypothetical protein